MHNLYIINKKNETERLNIIKNNFKTYNLTVVEAINHDLGWKGCFLSHKKCLQIAKKLGLKYIIVIEDDCKPTLQFNNNLDKILEYLNNNINEWDIFLGGVTNVWNYNNLVKINENLNLIKINKGKTTHLIIYNQRCYDFFLNHNINIPIDKCWHHKLKAVTCIPFIATQYDGISSIEKTYVNYYHKFNSIEDNFKKNIDKSNNILEDKSW